VTGAKVWEAFSGKAGEEGSDLCLLTTFGWGGVKNGDLWGKGTGGEMTQTMYAHVNK
jgi:hypothetical protein